MCIPSSRSGKRLKKTRKYDIITTPAERVEMAPLNDEDDEDEDSTVFDIKYRCAWAQPLLLGSRAWGGRMVYLQKPRRARRAFLFVGQVFDLEMCCLWGELRPSLPRVLSIPKADRGVLPEKWLFPAFPGCEQ